MAASKSTASGFVAAAILAALTLFVFYTFRDYGPASTVRRFNTDLIDKNTQDLQQILVSQTLAPSDEYTFEGIVKTVQNLSSSGVAAKIAAVEMIRSGEASVITVYDLGYRHLYLVWIVRSEPNQAWKIDPTLTVRANQSIAPGEAG